MTYIPFYKPSLGNEEINEVVDTLKSGWLTTGGKTKAFEADFAQYVRRKHAVAVNSCTAALHLALEAIGLRADETVVVPTMTFAATAEVVRYFNARPLLVDCRPDDFNLDVADAERRIGQAVQQGARVRAIIPVHFAGQVCDMAAVGRLAQRFDMKIVEDAAHCCPAYFRDESSLEWRPVGDTSDICCFSFYANKTITTGEGGMACTDNPDYAERMRIMSLHGISRDAWKRYTAEGSWYYEIIAPGFKYNLTDIAAAIGLHQLRKADRLHARRVCLAQKYCDALRGIDEIVLPQARPERIHSWHLFVIRLKTENLSLDRAGVIDGLHKAGVGTSVHWLPLHMHPYYRETFGYKPEDLPQSAQLYPSIISLPLYPDMSEGDVEYVCEQLIQLIAKHRKASRSATVSNGHGVLVPEAAGVQSSQPFRPNHEKS